MDLDFEPELGNYLGERRALVDAIERSYRKGTAATAIAEVMARRRVFGRDVVLDFLAKVKLRDAAKAALADVGLQDLVSVRVTGIDAPRMVLLTQVLDPAEVAAVDDLDTLPDRVRRALAPNIAMAPVDSTSGDDADVQKLLRDSQEVQLARARES